jgi:pimeloyl-ACP methyl ester carboxylesterase
MHFFEHDNIRFHYIDTGTGLPFVFQHGLTGDYVQPLGLYEETPGIRFISMDFRAHGKTQPLGAVDQLTFNTFADDLIALLDFLGIDQAIVGGISMGAGVALNLSLRHPARVLGLLMSRPAWLDKPLPPSLEGHAYAGKLMRDYGGAEARQRYLESEVYARLKAESPYVADSLLRDFEQPELAIRLEKMAQDAPNRDHLEWTRITVPTLILAHHDDPVHPFSYAEQLAGAIPTARLIEITAKGINEERYTIETQVRVREFLESFVA